MNWSTEALWDVAMQGFDDGICGEYLPPQGSLADCKPCAQRDFDLRVRPPEDTWDGYYNADCPKCAYDCEWVEGSCK